MIHMYIYWLGFSWNCWAFTGWEWWFSDCQIFLDWCAGGNIAWSTWYENKETFCFITFFIFKNGIKQSYTYTVLYRIKSKKIHEQLAVDNLNLFLQYTENERCNWPVTYMCNGMIESYYCYFLTQNVNKQTHVLKNAILFRMTKIMVLSIEVILWHSLGNMSFKQNPWDFLFGQLAISK